LTNKNEYNKWYCKNEDVFFNLLYPFLDILQEYKIFNIKDIIFNIPNGWEFEFFIPFNSSKYMFIHMVINYQHTDGIIYLFKSTNNIESKIISLMNGFDNSTRNLLLSTKEFSSKTFDLVIHSCLKESDSKLFKIYARFYGIMLLWTIFLIFLALI
jgi:hypothetical protein